MSRAYRIQVSEGVERVVHVDDGVATTLELLPILPKERMQALLARELEAAGLELDGMIARRTTRSPDGAVTVEVDCETGTVTVRVTHEEEVRATIERSRTVVEERKDAEQKRLQTEVEQALEREVERATSELQAKATARLEGELRDARGSLDAVVHRVTAAALKERAAQLGRIEEIAEDEAAGTLTIKVKV